LDQVRGEVHASEQPVIIADARGRILLTNSAFGRLMPATHDHLEWLDDLSSLFSDPGEARRRLADLVKKRHTWRGEVHLETNRADAHPLLIRADPVYAAPDRVRGFVLLLTDNTEQTAAAAARRRFQEGLINRDRVSSGRIDLNTDRVYRNLMSAAVENAQLAALEITDRADVERMPEMLESVRASVARIAEVLQHLIWHARRRAKP
jgi:hypothetical protein